MLSLDDPKWSDLVGGYRKPYDARSLLRRFANAAEEVACWDEVWNCLHHQGDIGSASYAVLPHVVRIYEDRPRDYNLYEYASMLEERRHTGDNPDVPDWLSESYRVAQVRLLGLAFDDVRTGAKGVFLRAILSFIAGFGGSPGLAAVLTNLDFCEEALAILGEYGESLHD